MKTDIGPWKTDIEPLKTDIGQLKKDIRQCNGNPILKKENKYIRQWETDFGQWKLDVDININNINTDASTMGFAQSILG